VGTGFPEGSCPKQQKKFKRVEGAPRVRAPQAVLFACGLNSVRSPMAASLLQRMFPQSLYVKSAGVKKGELDPFAVAVMAELGHDISGHKPITFEELEDWEGLNFDLIITLSPEAHHRALELTRTHAVEVEYWPTQDPTGAEGNREQKLQAYREVCDTLLLRIRKRFSKVGAASE
jgi:protein-tyrosine-phosphatase